MINHYRIIVMCPCESERSGIIEYRVGVSTGSSHHSVQVADISEAARDCTVLIFVVPHQFLRSVLGPIYSVKAKKPRTVKASMPCMEPPASILVSLPSTSL